jgi:hypothetical protein
LTGDDPIAGINIHNLIIRNCKINSSCNAFRIGGVDILVEDCHIYGPGYYPHRVTIVKNRYEVLPREAGRHNMLALVDYFASYVYPDEPSRNIVFRNCLIENLDDKESITQGDVFSFAKRCGCKVCGIAHTDLFAHVAKIGANPRDYFKRMADENIFWEMNVSYDQIHNYREHAYVKSFFADAAQQEIVRDSGVRLSVGFDGHRVGDYRPDRVVDCCKTLTALGLPLIFEE